MIDWQELNLQTSEYFNLDKWWSIYAKLEHIFKKLNLIYCNCCVHAVVYPNFGDLLQLVELFVDHPIWILQVRF